MKSVPIPGPQRSMSGAGERGFTLLEVLVALAILGTTLVAALEVTGVTLRTQAAASRHIEAVALAEAKMNELVLLSSDSLEWYTVARSGTTALPPRQYEWSALVRQDAETPRLWHAAVAIDWPDGRFDLETVFYRRERTRSLNQAR